MTEHRHYHFIGIGGVGMGKLASMVLDQGARVSGSDVRANDMVASLQERGAVIAIGHEAQHVQRPDIVVFSSAISQENPEMVEARRQGCRLMHRSELLNNLMNDYVRVTVAGAHGKTTTTAMVAKILKDAGCDPTVALGGVIRGDASRAPVGRSRIFVAEVDESDGSFLQTHPHISVVTNIDREHLDFYHDWDRVQAAFRQFVAQTEPGGHVVFCAEDPVLSGIVHSTDVRALSYGFCDGAEVKGSELTCAGHGGRFECVCGDRPLGVIELRVPGRHNALNALAAIGVSVGVMGLDPALVKKSLESFGGVHRRFELKGEVDGVTVIDDYGHHPTEIKATLAAARIVAGGRRVVVAFQPHRYTRTQALLDDFACCFSGADALFVTDIYAASECPIPGVSAERLVEHITRCSSIPAVYLPRNQVAEHLIKMVQSGDFVVTLGAGDITAVGPQIVEAMKKKVAVHGV